VDLFIAFLPGVLAPDSKYLVDILSALIFILNRYKAPHDSLTNSVLLGNNAMQVPATVVVSEKWSL
jgi:uncharacterized protein YejL (UPF0352 family)